VLNTNTFGMQVLFSTIALSGSLFMAQTDARTCVFRYFLSAVVARVILWYELVGMREASQGRYNGYTDEAQESNTEAGHQMEEEHQGGIEKSQSVVLAVAH